MLTGGTFDNNGSTMTNAAGSRIQGFGTVMTGGLTNRGAIQAHGGTLTLIGKNDINVAFGFIEAGPGDTVLFASGLSTNAGSIALHDGTFDNNGFGMTNAASGNIVGSGTVKTGGLTNLGIILAQGATLTLKGAGGPTPRAALFWLTPGPRSSTRVGSPRMRVSFAWGAGLSTTTASA